jgi:hypothetical protein
LDIEDLGNEDVPAMADLARMKAELAPARIDRKTKLQEKIN